MLLSFMSIIDSHFRISFFSLPNQFFLQTQLLPCDLVNQPYTFFKSRIVAIDHEEQQIGYNTAYKASFDNRFPVCTRYTIAYDSCDDAGNDGDKSA